MSLASIHQLILTSFLLQALIKSSLAQTEQNNYNFNDPKEPCSSNQKILNQECLNQCPNGTTSIQLKENSTIGYCMPIISLKNTSYSKDQIEMIHTTNQPEIPFSDQNNAIPKDYYIWKIQFKYVHELFRLSLLLRFPTNNILKRQVLLTIFNENGTQISQIFYENHNFYYMNSSSYDISMVRSFQENSLSFKPLTFLIQIQQPLQNGMWDKQHTFYGAFKQTYYVMFLDPFKNLQFQIKQLAIFYHQNAHVFPYNVANFGFVRESKPIRIDELKDEKFIHIQNSEDEFKKEISLNSTMATIMISSIFKADLDLLLNYNCPFLKIFDSKTKRLLIQQSYIWKQFEGSFTNEIEFYTSDFKTFKMEIDSKFFIFTLLPNTIKNRTQIMFRFLSLNYPSEFDGIIESVRLEFGNFKCSNIPITYTILDILYWQGGNDAFKLSKQIDYFGFSCDMYDQFFDYCFFARGFVQKSEEKGWIKKNEQQECNQNCQLCYGEDNNSTCLLKGTTNTFYLFQKQISLQEKCKIQEKYSFCQECEDGYILNYTLQKCLPKCAESFQTQQNSLLLPKSNCALCSENCLNCSHTDYCRECKPGYILSSGRCLKKCPQGCSISKNQSQCIDNIQKDQNGGEMVCQTCQDDCSICKQDPFYVCDKCQPSLLKFQGKCYLKCPNEAPFINSEDSILCQKYPNNNLVGIFPNQSLIAKNDSYINLQGRFTENQIIQNCPKNCERCWSENNQIGKSSCTQCYDDVIGTNQNSIQAIISDQCKFKISDGPHWRTTFQFCISQSQNYSYYGHQLCLKCAKQFNAQIKLVNQECKINLLDEYYFFLPFAFYQEVGGIDRKWQNDTQLISLIQNQNQVYFTDTHLVGFDLCSDSICEKCNIQKQLCLLCKKNYYRSLNGKCVKNCPIGYYNYNKSRICQACPNNCATCNEFQCLSCYVGGIKDKNCLRNPERNSIIFQDRIYFEFSSFNKYGGNALKVKATVMYYPCPIELMGQENWGNVILHSEAIFCAPRLSRRSQFTDDFSCLVRDFISQNCLQCNSNFLGLVIEGSQCRCPKKLPFLDRNTLECVDKCPINSLIIQETKECVSSCQQISIYNQDNSSLNLFELEGKCLKTCPYGFISEIEVNQYQNATKCIKVDENIVSLFNIGYYKLKTEFTDTIEKIMKLQYEKNSKMDLIPINNTIIPNFQALINLILNNQKFIIKYYSKELFNINLLASYYLHSNTHTIKANQIQEDKLLSRESLIKIGISLGYACTKLSDLEYLVQTFSYLIHQNSEFDDNIRLQIIQSISQCAQNAPNLSSINIIKESFQFKLIQLHYKREVDFIRFIIVDSLNLKIKKFSTHRYPVNIIIINIQNKLLFVKFLSSGIQIQFKIEGNFYCNSKSFCRSINPSDKFENQQNVISYSEHWLTLSISCLPDSGALNQYFIRLGELDQISQSHEIYFYWLFEIVIFLFFIIISVYLIRKIKIKQGEKSIKIEHHSIEVQKLKSVHYEDNDYEE